MPLLVRYTERALSDIEEYGSYILDHSHDAVAAQTWTTGVFDTGDTLEHLPHRCPFIPERHRLKQDLRQLRYESHRIIFKVEQDRVSVVRVYPFSGRPLRSLNQKAKPGPRLL